MSAMEIVAKGGGWYYPVDGDPDEDKMRLSKKAIKEGDYEIVELSTSAADDPGAVAAAEDTAPEVVPSSMEQETWGPYLEYQFVTTPYGEYAVPAGRVLVGFEPSETMDGTPYMKPIYQGTDRTRSIEERAILRQRQQERDQVLNRRKR